MALGIYRDIGIYVDFGDLFSFSAALCKNMRRKLGQLVYNLLYYRFFRSYKLVLLSRSSSPYKVRMLPHMTSVSCIRRSDASGSSGKGCFNVLTGFGKLPIY